MKSKIATVILSVFVTSLSYSQNRISKVGKIAPELSFEKFYNSPVATKNLQELKGKVVILDFWGSWCGPCIKSFAHTNSLSEAFKDQDVQFIAVGYEDSEKAKGILGKHQVKAWKAIDTDLSTFTAYEAWAIPLAFIIDKEGIVVAEIHPENITESIISDALQGKKIKSQGNIPYFDPEGAKEHFLSAVKK